jgi:hypothetical protein
MLSMPSRDVCCRLDHLVGEGGEREQWDNDENLRNEACWKSEFHSCYFLAKRFKVQKAQQEREGAAAEFAKCGEIYVVDCCSAGALSGDFRVTVNK